MCEMRAVVLFCLPVRCRQRGDCKSVMLGVSVALERVVLNLVLFSVAGTLGTSLVCTLEAAWVCCVRCSVGCICVCTLRSADSLDFRCACVDSINCWISLSSCSVVVASAPLNAWIKCNSAYMILLVCVSEELVMFLCFNWTVSKNCSLLVCLMWHMCVR